MKLRRAIVLYVSLALVLYVTAIPIYIMLKVAFADPPALVGRGKFVFSLKNLKGLLSAPENLLPPLRKSLVVAVVTAFVAVAISAPGAYVLAKIPGRAGYAFVLLIFFTRMVPEVGVALPISLNFMRMGLLDTVPGLVMAHLVRVLPLVAWVLIGTFKAIPPDLEEAGRMDGCSRFQVLYRVVAPMARPGIIVALIFGFLYSWDEFIYATYLCLMSKTLPLVVYHYVDRGGWFLSSMYALIVTVPVVIFTYYFQRYLQSGYLSGGVKG